MAREVCETCARVRIYYVESAVQVYADVPKRPIEPPLAPSKAKSDKRQCRLCRQPAMYMIPDGMSCDEHAWQAAARLDWQSTEPWVPIRIDRSNA